MARMTLEQIKACRPAVDRRKIEATICAGRLTHLPGQAALRFMGLGRAQTALAAE